MSEYKKFLPPDNLPALHAPFWESIARHRAAIQQCSGCDTFRFIPREICPQCHSTAAQWVPIGGLGEVYTYTTVHRAPTPAYQADAPYVIVHVTLAEGPRMIANLHGVDPDAVYVGMPVQIDYFDAAEGKTLFCFKPTAPN